MRCDAIRCDAVRCDAMPCRHHQAAFAVAFRSVSVFPSFRSSTQLRPTPGPASLDELGGFFPIISTIIT